MQDVIIIGAGPCGLSAAIECQRRGLSTRIIEKHCIVHSIFLYPTHMQFFSTAELLEIGDVPFPSSNEKPYRYEALAYYRKVASHYGLEISQYEEALSVEKKRTKPLSSIRRTAPESITATKRATSSSRPVTSTIPTTSAFRGKSWTRSRIISAKPIPTAA